MLFCLLNCAIGGKHQQQRMKYFSVHDILKYTKFVHNYPNECTSRCHELRTFSIERVTICLLVPHSIAPGTHIHTATKITRINMKARAFKKMTQQRTHKDMNKWKETPFTKEMVNVIELLRAHQIADHNNNNKKINKWRKKRRKA